MKKIFFAAAMAVFALASCSKENGGGDNTKAGLPTVLEIVVKQAGANTRAVSGAPTTAEQKLNDIVVYIFNQHDALEVIANFDATDLTNMFKTNIDVTTGVHKFLVAANIPDAAGVAPASMPAIGDAISTVQTKLMTIASFADITKNTTPDNHFFMTSLKDIVSKDLEKESIPTANVVELEIGRGMAKVSVSINDASISQPNGTLFRAPNDIEFFVVNNPTKMNYMPVYAGLQLKSPFFDKTFKVTTTPASGESCPADYFPEIKVADTYASLQTDGHWIATCLQSAGNATTSSYAVENSNTNPEYGESTYVMISGLYVPAAGLEWDGTSLTAVTPATTPATFWRIAKEKSPGIYEDYFVKDVNGDGTVMIDIFYKSTAWTQADIDAITSTSGVYKIVEYTGGRSFYGLWLADNTQTISSLKFCVPRNSYFDIVINEVKGPGSNTPIGVVPDPEEPIEESTVLKASIKIKDWSVIPQGGSIG